MGGSPATVHIDIPAGDAVQTLQGFMIQTGVQVMYSDPKVSSCRTAPVKGDLQPTDALERMLSACPVQMNTVNERVIALMPRSGSVTPTAEERQQSATLTTQHALAQKSRPAKSSEASSSEVVVQAEQDKPLLSVMPKYRIQNGIGIRQSGDDTAESLRNSTQNSGSFVIGSGNDPIAATNFAFAQAPNLRGLGSRSTGVRVDGRNRLPGSGSKGIVNDTSVIPEIAIDEIQFIADPPLAIALDAPSGVVNLVTRDHFEGSKTLLSTGSVTSGELRDFRLSQIVGKKWDESNLYVAFEARQLSALAAEDRALATSDLARFGGANLNVPHSRGGTLDQNGVTYAIPTLPGGRQPTFADLVPGTANLEDRLTDSDLTPDERRFGLFARGHWSPTSILQLHAQMLFSWRNVSARRSGQRGSFVITPTSPYYIDPGGGHFPQILYVNLIDLLGPVRNEASIRTRSAVIGGELALTERWTVGIDAAHLTEGSVFDITHLADSFEAQRAVNHPDPAKALNLLGGRAGNHPATLAQITTHSRQDALSKLSSVTLFARGGLFELPSGWVDLNVMAAAREDSFTTFLPLAGESGRRQLRPGWTTTSVVGELHVPLTRTLEYWLSTGFQHSRNGAESVPRIRLQWSPMSELKFIGSWGETYRDASPGEIAGDNSNTVTLLPDSTRFGGVARALIRSGSNSDLGPEHSRTWSLQLNYESLAPAGIRFNATYFNILVDGQLRDLMITNDVLRNPSYASSITPDPGSAQIASVCANGVFLASSAGASCQLSAPDYIVDLRQQSSKRVETSGVDLLFSYLWSLDIGRLGLGVDATYVGQFDVAPARGLPFTAARNTANHPIDWRGRTTVSYGIGQFLGVASVNYLNSYEDTVSRNRREIPSWTTFDLTLSYALPGFEVRLDAQNLTDKSPPFAPAAYGLGFDELNASARGRFLQMKAQLTW